MHVAAQKRRSLYVALRDLGVFTGFLVILAFLFVGEYFVRGMKGDGQKEPSRERRASRVDRSPASRLLPFVPKDAQPLTGDIVTAEGDRYTPDDFLSRFRAAGKGMLPRGTRALRADGRVVSLFALGIDMNMYAANAFLIGFEPFRARNMWIPMDTISRRLRYESDNRRFPLLNDVWQSSKQAYYWLRGDCEDHAILLADWLMAAGYDARVVTGRNKRGGHAWVVLLENDEVYLIEATAKRSSRLYPLAAFLPEYRPRAMFNRSQFWINEGTTLTTDYLGDHWKLRSTFEAQLLYEGS